MIEAGANIFRLNMNHATHDWVRHIVPRIRAIAIELDTMVGILLDTQGPAIRTGDLCRRTVHGDRRLPQKRRKVFGDGGIAGVGQAEFAQSCWADTAPASHQAQ